MMWQEDSDICDVLLNIRADDMFHQVCIHI